MMIWEAMLKTISKSLPPNALTVFASLDPTANWDPDFRDYAVPPNASGHDYKQIKQLLLADQGGLCAYCERPLGDLGPSSQRVEHYHPKSDKSVPLINWGLRWDNVILVCTGGEQDDGDIYPRPVNLSCDSYKNHWLRTFNLSSVQLLTLLSGLQNPLTLAPFPCPFDFDLLTGRFTVNEPICSEIDGLLGLSANATFTSLDKTVNIALNLNCDRLCTDRLQVLIQYNREREQARKRKDKDFRQKLAAKWFSKKWPSYFTTRRILLGQAAEAKLVALGYTG